MARASLKNRHIYVEEDGNTFYICTEKAIERKMTVDNKLLMQMGFATEYEETEETDYILKHGKVIRVQVNMQTNECFVEHMKKRKVYELVENCYTVIRHGRHLKYAEKDGALEFLRQCIIIDNMKKKEEAQQIIAQMKEYPWFIFTDAQKEFARKYASIDCNKMSF